MLGWESVATGRYRNLGVAGQSDAIHRGGYLDLDIASCTVGVRMSDDGSGDILTVAPVLTPGATVGSFSDVGWGWSAPLTGMANGANKLWLVDLQDARVNQQLAVALPDFTPNGIAIVFGGIPVAAIPQSGEWRPETLQLGGAVADRLGFHVQPNEQGIPDVFQPAYIPGSGALYDSLRVNDIIGVGNFMTGKIGQMLCVCIGWRAGKVTGYAFGRLEYNPLTKQADKVFDAATVRAAIGAATSVSVSVDLGYSSVGASVSTNCQALAAGGPWTASSGGSVTSITYYTRNTTAGHNKYCALYVNAVEPPSGTYANNYPTSLVTGSQTPNFQPTTTPSWQTVSYSSSPTIVSGVSYFMGMFRPTTGDGSFAIYYDGLVAGHSTNRRTSFANASAPDPFPSGSSVNNWRTSAYLTYTPAASGGIIPKLQWHGIGYN